MDPARFRRVAGFTTLVAAVFMLVATVLFLAASGFDWRTLDEPSRLLGIGSGTIELLRWSLIADMLVYLLSIPLFLCVGSELEREHGSSVRVLTTAGVLYAIVGAITATIFSYAGPPLLHSYTSCSSQSPGLQLRDPWEPVSPGRGSVRIERFEDCMPGPLPVIQ